MSIPRNLRRMSALLLVALLLPACTAKVTATADGYTVHVEGTGFPKNQAGTAQLINADDVVVDEKAGSSDANGTFAGTLTAPAAGEYTVKITSADNKRSATTTVTVHAPDEPPTTPPPDCGGETIYRADGTAWECSFHDEFSGSSLDTSKWFANDSRVTAFRAGGACQTPDAVSVADGSLTITVSRETTPVTCPNYDGTTHSTPYKSGSVSTSDTREWVDGAWKTTDRFSQAYGRFEIRAQYPSAVDPGIHGAFWMVPDDKPEGQWPAYGEIDVAEFWSADIGSPYGGNPTHLSPFLHFQGSPDRSVNRGDKPWRPADTTGDPWDNHACTPLHPEQWHTYTLDWRPSGMSFLVDGEECASVAASYWDPAYAEDGHQLTAPAPFNKPFNLILTMSVHGDTSTISPAVSFPQTYNIDYVRVWK